MASTSLQDQAIAHPDGRQDEKRRRQSRPFFRNRAVYSAIDLGTNNCRLLIAKPHRDGFRVVDAFSRIVRLGEGVDATNRLSDASMARAIDALKVCARKIKRRHVTCMRAVATEACRMADNCAEFVARVKDEVGLNLDIISPAEEVRLAVAGCQTLLSASSRYALVLDIGGGSTELILVERVAAEKLMIRAWTSIPYGVVNLAERYGCRSMDPEVYESMVAAVCEMLDTFEELAGLKSLIGQQYVQLIGTSGTVTTLASVRLGLRRYDRNRIDGLTLSARDLHKLSRQVALMPYEKRLKQPCIGSDRADYVVAGCGILDAILGQWQFDRLTVADRGIREGILRGLMGKGAEVAIN